MNELWKALPGWEDRYEVSDHGNVRSLDGYRKGRMLKLVPDKGYRIVTLARPGVRRNKGVHVCVALAFLGPRPKGLQVCHNNGKRDDNRIENLRYGTPRQNVEDQLKHRTWPRQNRHYRYDASIDEQEILRLRAAGLTLKQLTERLSISWGMAARVVRGERWRPEKYG